MSIRLHGVNYDEASDEAHRLVREEGLTLIHPFDDPEVGTARTCCCSRITRWSHRWKMDTHVDILSAISITALPCVIEECALTSL